MWTLVSRSSDQPLCGAERGHRLQHPDLILPRLYSTSWPVTRRQTSIPHPGPAGRGGGGAGGPLSLNFVITWQTLQFIVTCGHRAPAPPRPARQPGGGPGNEIDNPSERRGGGWGVAVVCCGAFYLLHFVLRHVICY